MKTLADELRDQIDRLRAENERLTNKLNLAHGKHTEAAKRAHKWEMSYRRVQEENARLEASERDIAALAVDEADEDEPFPTIDPELVSLRRLIRDLRDEDHETFAPAICWALNAVQAITDGLRTETGKVRVPVRRRAA